jgi:hypothetical protein
MLYRYKCGVGLLASWALLGCVRGVLPHEPEPRSQAIGTVHLSSPLFTPLDPFREDRALDFKELRSEAYLNDRVNHANMSVSTAVSREVGVSAGVRVQGKAASDQTTAATAETAASSGASSGALLDEESRQRVSKILQSTDAKYLLAPDDVATIVAALKLYMVSLEDYYNAVAVYNDALRRNPNWVPYRVHFTVTVDPGWFTQLNGYDAVAEVSIGNPGEVQVLTVIPPQSMQAFEQFSATFRSLGASLSGELVTNRVAARAAIRALRTAAERLEGLRANTTFAAAAFGGNRMRLRFRPSIVPGQGQIELQPLSRIVTAVVLIKPEGVRAQPADRRSTDCLGTEGREKRKQWFAHGIRAANSSAKGCLASGEIEITHSVWFEAGPSFSGGSRRKPQVPARQRTLCRSSPEPSSCREQETTAVGYLPRWTPTAVFGAANVVVRSGIFWPTKIEGILHAVVSFELKVPAPEDGFRINVQGPGLVRCASTWDEIAAPCTDACLSAEQTSFLVLNPRASTFVCEFDGKTLGDAEQVPIYVTAASDSVSTHGMGVDYSSVVTESVLHRAVFSRTPPAPAPATPAKSPP